MKTNLFTVLFFVLPAVAFAKEGFNPKTNDSSFFSACTKVTADKPAFAKATIGQPAFAKATIGQPAFAKATIGQPAFAKATIGQPAFAKATAGKGGDPVDIKVVVSQKRIWLVADEMPMKCLKTLIKNAEGKIVLEKCFSSKCAEWFLNIEALPKGEYTLYLGDRVEKFKK